MALVYVRETPGVGEYGSLAAAIAASETDIEIVGAWDDAEELTEDIAISSATTIEATGDAKHPGYVGSSPTHYRVIQTINGQHGFITTADVIFTGMDMSSETTGVSDEIIRINANNVDLVCDSCLLWFDSRNDQQDLIYLDSQYDCSVTLTNCVGWNAYRAGIDVYCGSGPVDVVINSCSFYNIGFSTSAGIRSGVVGIYRSYEDITTVRVFNTIAHIHTGYFTTSGTPASILYIDNSITTSGGWQYGDWNSATITNSSTSIPFTATAPTVSSVYVENITSGSEDFRLKTHTNNLAEEWTSATTGANLTMPSVDIVGTSRPQDTDYDCGAFEIVSGGSILPIKLSVHNSQQHWRA